MTKQEVKQMIEQLQESNQKRIWVDKFDEEDWADLMKKPPTGFSWSEESFLAYDEYRETDKEYLRCN
jgi:hypothetical protein